MKRYSNAYSYKMELSIQHYFFKHGMEQNRRVHPFVWYMECQCGPTTQDSMSVFIKSRLYQKLNWGCFFPWKHSCFRGLYLHNGTVYQHSFFIYETGGFNVYLKLLGVQIGPPQKILWLFSLACAPMWQRYLTIFKRAVALKVLMMKLKLRRIILK